MHAGAAGWPAGPELSAPRCWRPLVTGNGSVAAGPATYEIDGCNPDCAAGPVYHVPAVVTLSNPVKACSSSGSRWFWTRATFRYPNGLPAALPRDEAPTNPWVFSPVVTAAQQSCAS